MQPDNRQEYFLRKQEEEEIRRDRFRLVTGILEFLGVIAGVIVILILVALLISLFSWVKQDLAAFISIFKTKLP